MEVAALVISIVSIVLTVGLGIGLAAWGTQEQRKHRRLDYRYATAIELVDLLTELRTELRTPDLKEIGPDRPETNDFGNYQFISEIPVPTHRVEELVPRIVGRAAALGFHWEASSVHIGHIGWHLAIDEASDFPKESDRVAAVTEALREYRNDVSSAVSVARELAWRVGEELSGVPAAGRDAPPASK